LPDVTGDGADGSGGSLDMSYDGVDTSVSPSPRRATPFPAVTRFWWLMIFIVIHDIIQIVCECSRVVKHNMPKHAKHQTPTGTKFESGGRRTKFAIGTKWHEMA
jgi:hypothetical protein